MDNSVWEHLNKFNKQMLYCSETEFTNADNSKSNKIIIHLKDDTIITINDKYAYIEALSCFELMQEKNIPQKGCFLCNFLNENFKKEYIIMTEFPELLLGNDVIYRLKSIIEPRDLFSSHLIIKEGTDISHYSPYDNTTKYINIYGIELVENTPLYFVTHVLLNNITLSDMFDIICFCSYESLCNFLKYDRTNIYIYKCESKNNIKLIQIEPMIILQLSIIKN